MNQSDELKVIKKTSQLFLMTCIGWSGLFLFSNQALAAKSNSVANSNASQTVVNTTSDSSTTSQPASSTQATTGYWDDFNSTYNSANHTLTIGPKTNHGEAIFGPTTSAPWKQTNIASEVQHIDIEPGCIANSDSESLFSSLPKLISIRGLSNLDVENVMDMGAMFRHDRKLQYLDLSGWNTSSLKDMSHMFMDCHQLVDIKGIGSLNTSKVTNMTATFSDSTSLYKLPIGNWQTQNVTTMANMFYRAVSLSSLDLSSWNTSRVTDMENMFFKDFNLTSLNINGFTTTANPKLGSMFYNCNRLQKLNLENFDVTTSMTDTDFLGSCTKLWWLRLNDHSTLGSKAELPDVPGDGRSIPDGSGYVNAQPKWVALAGGSEHDPRGTEYTSDQLMTARPVETETYVWQQTPTEDKTSIESKPEVDLWVGDSFNPESAFLSATDRHGANVPFGQVVYAEDPQNPLDTNTPGSYNVTYTNGTQTATTKVVVHPDQRALMAYVQVNLTVGDQWNPESGFISAYDKKGEQVDYDNNVTVTGTVDTSTPGTYKVTYHYDGMTADTEVNVKDKVTPPTPNPTPTPTPTPTPMPNPTTPSNPYWNPTNPTNSNGNTNGTGSSSNAEVTKLAVYAVKPIYMYQNPNFKKSQRIVKYPKTKRTNRPMFVVTGYKKSNNGALRYKVKDVNRNRQSFGKTGYITTNNKYVTTVYYKTMPKNKRITVISKHGIRSYNSPSLAKRNKVFKKGTQLRVKKLVEHDLTTRYELNNGHYITANKKFIIQGKY